VLPGVPWLVTLGDDIDGSSGTAGGGLDTSRSMIPDEATDALLFKSCLLCSRSDLASEE
jgi:hypothetical protein